MPIKAENITIYSIYYDSIDFDDDLVPGIVPDDGGHRFVIELTSGAAMGERREITDAGTSGWNDKNYFKLNSLSNLSSGDFFRVIQLVVPDVDNFSLRDVCIVINPNNNTLQDCFDAAEEILFDPAYQSDEHDSLYCFRNYGSGTYFNEYGALYNWWAMDGLAANGWRVPSDADFTALTDYIDNNYNTDEDEFGVGNHLKSCRQINSPLGGSCDTSEHPRWDEHSDEYGRDSVKFGGLPGGYCNSNGNFSSVGSYGRWWSSTEYDATYAWSRHMGYGFGIVPRSYVDKSYGFSARCLRDATLDEQGYQGREHEDYMEEGIIQPNEYTGHDEKTYDAVRIGTQVWITENLKETKRMVSGSLVDIPIVTNDTEWSNLTTAAMCAYPKP